MSQQALSTTPYRVILRRAMLRSAGMSAAIGTSVVVFAMGPFMARHGAAFLGGAARPTHAPDLGLIVQAPLAVQLHLVTILAALAVTLVLMFGAKGTRAHRTLGWIWSAIMLITAVSSLFIPAPPNWPSFHGVGVLHLFALITFLSVPRAVLAARRHDVTRHAGIISGFVMGGLGLAGLLAFMPGRLLWAVWFG